MDKEKQKIRSARYFQNKKEKRMAYNKKYAQENREKVRTLARNYYKNNQEKLMLWRAKSRAIRDSLDFNLSIEDIIIPSTCPLLGVPLFKGEGKLCPNSPTLDKIDPIKGYTKGNVWVISHRANTIKSNCSLEEFESIFLNWKKKVNG